MSSVIYPMLIFIFAFGATCAYINESGIYAERLPESGVAASLQQVNDTNRAMLDASKSSGLNQIEQLGLFGKSVLGGVIAIFTLQPLLVSMGFPIGMAGVFLSPLGIVLLFTLFEWWFGRPAE